MHMHLFVAVHVCCVRKQNISRTCMMSDKLTVVDNGWDGHLNMVGYGGSMTIKRAKRTNMKKKKITENEHDEGR